MTRAAQVLTSVSYTAITSHEIRAFEAHIKADQEWLKGYNDRGEKIPLPTATWAVVPHAPELPTRVSENEKRDLDALLELGDLF